MFKRSSACVVILMLAACQASTPHKSSQQPHKPASAEGQQNASAAAKQKPLAVKKDVEPVIDPKLTGPQKIPLPFSPGSAVYPKEWGEQGVQGEVVYGGQINTDGMAQNVVLIKGSGNAQLDQNALGFAQKVRFRLEKRRSATEPEPVEFAFQFYTHDLYTFGQKTCAQFLHEVDYFKKTFPNKPADEVIGYHAMSGLAFLYAMQKNPQTKVRGSNFAQDVEYCQKNPQRPLMQWMLEGLGVTVSK